MNDFSSKKYRNKIFHGKEIGFSGTLTRKRKEMIELIQKNGGIFNQNITKKCHYLVTTNDFKMNQKLSIKHKNAIKYGVKIMKEQWINDCIKQKKLINYKETDYFGRNYCINKKPSFQSQQIFLPSKPLSIKPRNMANNRIMPQNNVAMLSDSKSFKLRQTPNIQITDSKYIELNARVQTLEQQNINNNQRMDKLEVFL